jgi:hypothetical protein
MVEYDPGLESSNQLQLPYFHFTDENGEDLYEDVVVANFIRSLKPFFDELINGRFRFKELLGESESVGVSEEEIQAAWDEVSSIPDQAANDLLEDSMRYIKLQDIGFKGANLKLKGNFFNGISDSLQRAASSIMGFFSSSIPFDPANFVFRKMVEWLKQLLAYLNAILGSLTKAIPALEAIKELKDLLENGYELAITDL